MENFPNLYNEKHKIDNSNLSQLNINNLKKYDINKVILDSFYRSLYDGY